MTLNGRSAAILGGVALFAASVLLVVCGTAYAVWQGQRQASVLAAQAAALSAEIRTLCAEQGDVGRAPVPAKASELGVKLIVDFRDAYAGLGCSPVLPPPPASLVRLAVGYGITVRH